jgi:hypothetical protein
MGKIPRSILRRAIGYSGKIKTKKAGLCHFRSMLELKCITLLDASDKVEYFIVEPKNLKIPYDVQSNNKLYRKKYTPDIFVKFKDGRKAVFEVKPESQKKWMLNLFKWSKAKKVFESAGVEFYIIDDKALKGFI